MMRKPKEGEGIICPEDKTKTISSPESVYDVTTPDRKTVSRGILGKHSHDGGPECDYSGLPVEVIPIPKKD